MSEHDELVKRLNKYAETVAFGSDLREAAQAIERLEAHTNELADWREATAARADKAESDAFDVWLRAEKAERQLADARAEIERHRIALERIAEETAATWVADAASAALATPAPMDELQRLGQEYDAAPGPKQESGE